MKGCPVPREQCLGPAPASRTAQAVSQLYCRVIRGDSVSQSAIHIPLAGESNSCPEVIFGE